MRASRRCCTFEICKEVQVFAASLPQSKGQLTSHDILPLIIFLGLNIADIHTASIQLWLRKTPGMGCKTYSLHAEAVSTKYLQSATSHKRSSFEPLALMVTCASTYSVELIAILEDLL
jgi:hypothetical protein